MVGFWGLYDNHDDILKSLSLLKMISKWVEGVKYTLQQWESGKNEKNWNWSWKGFLSVKILPATYRHPLVVMIGIPSYSSTLNPPLVPFYAKKQKMFLPSSEDPGCHRPPPFVQGYKWPGGDFWPTSVHQQNSHSRIFTRKYALQNGRNTHNNN